MSSSPSSSKPPLGSRPVAKQSHNTWPRYAAPRTHFEDFMREIGAPTHSCHLCCVPRPVPETEQGTQTRKALTSLSKGKLSDGRSMERGRRRTGTTASVTQPRDSQRSAWFSLGVTYSSRHKLSLFPVSSLVKAGGLSSIFKAEPQSAVDTQCCLIPRADFNHPRSVRQSLRSLLGEDESTEPHDTQDVHTHSFDEATQNSDCPTPLAPDARSISRSSSLESLATASSSEAPATPKTHSSSLPGLSPVLADLENSSRFRIEAVCITCKKTGSNFPRCGRCGEMWCSRHCRLKGSNGQRHLCGGDRLEA